MNKSPFLSILFISLFSFTALSAQVSMTLGGNENDSTLRAILLKSIREEHDESKTEHVKKIEELNDKLAVIDKKLSEERDANKKVSALTERVAILEQKESSVNNNVISVYQQNYKTAVVNLFFMERELKPLQLFNSSRDFFNSLSSVSNPMSYKGYQQWFSKYKEFIDGNKKKDATLLVVDRMLSLTGDISKGLPLAGPISNALFNGISLYINSFGKKDDAIREESIKMFELTSVLSQFVHERDLIEHEWDKLHKELEELQKLHEKCLLENLEILAEKKAVFDASFTNQTDAGKYFDYVKKLTDNLTQIIQKEQKENPEKWKSKFYYQMQAVQSLKIRFGNLTFQIKENIQRYQVLIQKYSKTDIADIKQKMSELSIKLEQLNNAFDKQFSPQEYINAASQMYIVD